MVVWNVRKIMTLVSNPNSHEGRGGMDLQESAIENKLGTIELQSTESNFSYKFATTRAELLVWAPYYIEGAQNFSKS